jgi:TatD DNase family protein
VLREAIAEALEDPLFVGIGEIGLDFFVPALKEAPLREKQEFFFAEQLKLAREFACRCCCMCAARRTSSEASAPHPRSRRHRPCLQRQRPAGPHLRRTGAAPGLRRCHDLPAFAADSPPGKGTAAVVHRAGDRRARYLAGLAPSRHQYPRPDPRIGEVLAELRQMPLQEIAAATTANAQAALPRLAHAGLGL